MVTSTNHVTIDEALDRFLADQRERTSDKTFRRYQDVVQLLRHSLDGYAYSWLDENERQRWEKELEANEEGAFCRLFGPEKIPEHLGAFLGDAVRDAEQADRGHQADAADEVAQGRPGHSLRPVAPCVTGLAGEQAGEHQDRVQHRMEQLGRHQHE